MAWAVFLSFLLFFLHDHSGRGVGASDLCFVGRVED